MPSRPRVLVVEDDPAMRGGWRGLGNVLIPDMLSAVECPPPCHRVRALQPVVGAPSLKRRKSPPTIYRRGTPVAERKAFSAYASKRDRTQTDAKKREQTQRLSARVRSRVGVFKPVSRNPNNYWPFSLKPHVSSNLGFADSVVGSHPFASVCGFCNRNDTRNDTRRE